jgi:hypothetical protein
MADRQLAALTAQVEEMQTSIADLHALRETAVDELSKLPED